MRLVDIWRYPVKSLQGEQLGSADVTPEGIVGDRRFAIFDVETGLGLTARRVPQLLLAAATLRDDGGVCITLPDGSPGDSDAALSGWLGRRVTLRSAADTTERRYENPVDFEDEDGTWEPFSGASGAFHDSGRTNVSLVSTTTLGAWNRRRFRANLVLDGAGEDELVGGHATIGSVRLDVRKQIDRCVMTTRPQPGGIDKDLDVLRSIHRERDGYLAIGAVVHTPGSIRIGDLLQGD